MTELRAFTNTPITKERFLYHIREHIKQDAFIKGSYGNLSKINFTGCAVGCSLNSIKRELGTVESCSNHKLYEKYLGVPEWLALLEDTLFENLSDKRSKQWTLEFSKAINVGSDLNQIKVPFIVYLMEENLKSLNKLKIDKNLYPDVFNSIQQSKDVINYMIFAQETEDQELIKDARSAAKSAAKSAAAWSSESAESAAWSSAWLAARSAAWSAAWSAESAARSAGSAARSAAWSSEMSARSATYEKQANKLIKLMKQCKY